MIFCNFGEYDKEIITSALTKIGRVNEIMNSPHINSQTKVKIKKQNSAKKREKPLRNMQKKP